jgi:linoleoyl-CoA desaturase
LLRGFGRKAGRQVAKDYLLWPSLAGPVFVHVAAADGGANLIRNLWSYAIIFCGHFPDGVHLFPRDVIEDETRSGWYLRQLLGSANITGGPTFHVLAGNLSFQIEHHLFPDMPSTRYQRVAPRIEALCARYGLPYNAGPLRRRLGTTLRKIWRYALPGGHDVRSEGPAVRAG